MSSPHAIQSLNRFIYLNNKLYDIADYMKALAILASIIGIFMASAMCGAAVAGMSSIHAPAVILFNNTGSLTNISITITSGNGAVNVIGPVVVGQSTIQSAKVAAMYASIYTHHNESLYNFTYSIEDAGDNVSGPSAGAAMTMLAISAFDGKPLRSNFTMTGTISSDGSIGEIGGVYNKVAAAKASGMRLVLVPKVPSSSTEDELYLLVQTTFGIPLVQVANISQAAHFAFYGSISGLENMTTYDFYTNYSVQSLPESTINCSSECNYSTFNTLLNATFVLTRSEIDNLQSNKNFSAVAAQLGMVLNQSSTIAARGYIYTAADFAFLDYLNAFYFNSYPSTRSSALGTMTAVQNSCASLTPPPLTKQNYNYVISAELRQAWGTYTINSSISAYNASQIESDQILDDMYLAAQANAWCKAAGLIYNESDQTGNYVTVSQSLQQVAHSRIERALPSSGSNLYLSTAQQAYKEQNYPLAILDADYAYVLFNTVPQNMTVQEINAAAQATAANSTYGVWATEFARESQFYIYESGATANSTLSRSYAVSAYTTAQLANALSNDTRLISGSLVPVSNPMLAESNAQLAKKLRNAYEFIYAETTAIAVLLAISIILSLLIIKSDKRPRRRYHTKKRR